MRRNSNLGPRSILRYSPSYPDSFEDSNERTVEQCVGDYQALLDQRTRVSSITSDNVRYATPEARTRKLNTGPGRDDWSTGSSSHVPCEPERFSRPGCMLMPRASDTGRSAMFAEAAMRSSCAAQVQAQPVQPTQTLSYEYADNRQSRIPRHEFFVHGEHADERIEQSNRGLVARQTAASSSREVTTKPSASPADVPRIQSVKCGSLPRQTEAFNSSDSECEDQRREPRLVNNCRSSAITSYSGPDSPASRVAGGDGPERNEDRKLPPKLITADVKWPAAEASAVSATAAPTAAGVYATTAANRQRSSPALSLASSSSQRAGCSASDTAANCSHPNATPAASRSWQRQTPAYKPDALQRRQTSCCALSVPNQVPSASPASPSPRRLERRQPAPTQNEVCDVFSYFPFSILAWLIGRNSSSTAASQEQRRRPASTRVGSNRPPSTPRAYVQASAAALSGNVSPRQRNNNNNNQLTDTLLTRKLTLQFERCAAMPPSEHRSITLKETLSQLPVDNLYVIEWLIKRRIITMTNAHKFSELLFVKVDVLDALIEESEVLFQD